MSELMIVLTNVSNIDNSFHNSLTENTITDREQFLPKMIYQKERCACIYSIFFN